jgi:hypothetical protein
MKKRERKRGKEKEGKNKAHERRRYMLDLTKSNKIIFNDHHNKTHL